MSMMVQSGRFGGGASAGAHRYWRTMFTTITGGITNQAVALAGFEMYEDRWGPNLIGPGMGSVTGAITSYPGSNLWDEYLYDQNGAVWAAFTTAGVIVDFGAGNEKAIVSVGLHTGYTGNAEGVNAPTDFYTQYSDDGSNWTTAWSVTGFSWSGKRFARFPDPASANPSYSGSPYGSHRYWRFNASATAGAGYTSAGEIQFRATPGGADQCTGGTPFANSYFSAPATTYAPDKAFDDNNSTFWVNNGGIGWIGYDFGGAPVSVGELVIRSRHDTQTDQTPRWGVLQFADSSTGPWSSTLEISNQLSWGTGDQRTFTDPNYV